MSTRVPLTFRIFRGARLVREQTLTQGVIKLGKVPSAHLQLDDESVSRMHAILEIDHAGTVHVIDLGSTRGTFVNGHRINKAKLESGDSLQLGELRVEVTIGAVQPADTAVRAPDAAVRAVRPADMPVRPMFVAEPGELAGAKAIEVAAMLGDSVVGVKHCTDPRGGRISAKTWGFLAASVASLAVSAIAFWTSVSTAAFNTSALEYWTHVAHKPAYSFRPQVLGMGYDWLAFGGLGLGLVAAAIALVRIRDERKSPYYRIGTAPGVELALEGAPAASFPLVAPAGDDFVFNYGAGIDGELIVDGASTPLAELGRTGRAHPSATVAGAIEVPIPARARIRARSGHTTFVVSAVAQPRRHATPLLAGIESRALAYFAGSLAAHLGIWALLQQIPADGGAADVELGYSEEVAIRSETKTQEEKPQPPEDNGGDSGANDDGSSSKMALEAGASGNPNAVAVEGHLRVKDNGTPPQMSRAQAIEDARAAGMMGDLAPLRDAISAAAGTDDLTSGFDANNQWGPLIGAEGEGRGSFGFARSGWGRGGGCSEEPCGGIASGNYDLIGRGRGVGDGYNIGTGGGPGGHRHTPQAPQPVFGTAHVVGDYDKSIIRRYIKRNLAKIQYCYEHELLAHQELVGEIEVQFFILPTGVVKSATGKGFDPTIANCVADVVAHIEFPAPGGGVEVNYPFNFRAAGH